jgi:hypothetical protein
MDGIAAEAIEHTISAILTALGSALAPAVAQEANYFSDAAPVVCLITMGAQGADLLGARAADKSGLKIAYVIPYASDEYRNDFSPAAATIAEQLMSRSKALLELPGNRDEGPRAYERANDVILANIDLLVAVWDGGRAQGRAGTGDVVQAAVARRIPIIVIDPRSPSAAVMLAQPINILEAPAAADLARKPLPTDFIDLVHGIVSPPSRRVQRQSLSDMITETPRASTWRFEYPLLLKTVGGRPFARRPPTPRAAESERRASEAAAPSSFAYANQLNVTGLDRARQTIDGLAVQYGRLYRSSSVSQYLVVILGVWISGVIGILVPSLAAASIVVQVLANALVLADSAFSSRHRWQERWLDYRVVAERLRWLNFRCRFGLGAGRLSHPATPMNLPWTDWYLQRWARAMGPPQGKIDAASIAAAADQLLNVEIPDQIKYHRVAVRQLGKLERRLSFAAHSALVAALGVAVALGIAALRLGSLTAVGWNPLAIALLAVLPSTMTGLNGLRVNADLVRLVERSAQTTVSLFRVRHVIAAAPRDYDHVAFGMQQLASILGNELADWRFVIESRRSRGSRRQIGKKRNKLLRALSGA